AALVAVDARVAGELPRARAERAAQCAVAGDDLGDCGPRAACRTVAAVPPVERLVEIAGGGAEHEPLQRVHERTDGELGNQPQQIRRQAAVDRAAAHRALI